MPSPVTQYRTCRHVFAKGRICGCAALKDHIFCLHHQRDRQRRANLRAGLAAKFRAGEEDLNAEIVASLDLPAPDDPEAALVCLSNTFLALAAGAIPEKRAALMIYNLQTINSAMYNLLKFRELEAGKQKETGVVEERAVTDPEPIASILLSNRQADFEFSEQRYVQRLETETQNPTQRHGDTEERESVGFVVPSEAAAKSRDLGFQEHKQNQDPSTALGVTKQVDDRLGVTEHVDAATAEAAFNADAARLQALDHGDLLPPAEAPNAPDVIAEAANAMSTDDWEKHVQQLWLCGYIQDAQREKLHARIFSPQKSVRDAARRLALKYAPDKVREVLSRQPSAVSSQQNRDEPLIA